MSDNESRGSSSERGEPSASSISERVADELRDAIYDGEFAVGEPLPTEHGLSEQMGASRASIREALRMVEAQGLIRTVGRPQSRVVSPEGPIAPLRGSIDALLRVKRASPRNMHSIRLALEIVAVREVAGAAGRPDCDLRRAEAGLNRMRGAEGDVEAFYEADAEFHAGLVDAANNEVVTVLMSAFSDGIQEFLTEALTTKPRLTDERLRASFSNIVAEHEAVLDAVLAGDADRATLRLIHNIEHYRGWRDAKSGSDL